MKYSLVILAYNSLVSLDYNKLKAASTCLQDVESPPSAIQKKASHSFWVCSSLTFCFRLEDLRCTIDETPQRIMIDPRFHAPWRDETPTRLHYKHLFETFGLNLSLSSKRKKSEIRIHDPSQQWCMQFLDETNTSSLNTLNLKLPRRYRVQSRQSFL